MEEDHSDGIILGCLGMAGYGEKLEKELPSREKLELKMRYGLYQGEEYTQREIAAQLGISRSYVSRIVKRAIEILRGYF